jgi:hypothetical protein
VLAGILGLLAPAGGAAIPSLPPAYSTDHGAQKRAHVILNQRELKTVAQGAHATKDRIWLLANALDSRPICPELMAAAMGYLEMWPGGLAMEDRPQHAFAHMGTSRHVN